MLVNAAVTTNFTHKAAEMGAVRALLHLAVVGTAAAFAPGHTGRGIHIGSWRAVSADCRAGACYMLTIVCSSRSSADFCFLLCVRACTHAYVHTCMRARARVRMCACVCARACACERASTVRECVLLFVSVRVRLCESSGGA
jgi:hypothetical protein